MPVRTGNARDGSETITQCGNQAIKVASSGFVSVGRICGEYKLIKGLGTRMTGSKAKGRRGEARGPTISCHVTHLLGPHTIMALPSKPHQSQWRCLGMEWMDE